MPRLTLMQGGRFSEMTDPSVAVIIDYQQLRAETFRAGKVWNPKHESRVKERLIKRIYYLFGRGASHVVVENTCEGTVCGATRLRKRLEQCARYRDAEFTIWQVKPEMQLALFD